MRKLREMQHPHQCKKCDHDSGDYGKRSGIAGTGFTGEVESDTPSP